jgi:tetratricopeptide (TPR) repeat protein
MAEVARAHNLPGQEAEALTNLSKVYGLRGDNEERLRLLERARELAESSGNRLVQARVERVLGFAVALLRSAQEGQELLESAAQVLDELGDTDELAMAVMMLGDLDFRAGNGDAALQRYRESLAMVMDHVGYRPELKRRIATALLETGRLDEAAPVAEEARQETAKDDWATVAITATVLGNVRFAQGRTSEAEELLRSGVEVIDRTEFPGIDEYLSLARFLARTGRLDEAREWLAKTYELVRAYPPDSPWAEAVNRRATEIEAEADGAGAPGG